MLPLRSWAESQGHPQQSLIWLLLILSLHAHWKKDKKWYKMLVACQKWHKMLVAYTFQKQKTVKMIMLFMKQKHKQKNKQVLSFVMYYCINLTSAQHLQDWKTVPGASLET